MSPTTLIDLPSEILSKIFQYVELKDLRSLMLTCSVIRNIVVNDKSVWKSYFYLSCKRRIGQILPPLYWYNQCRISCNWSKGVYRSKIVLQHNINYMPWIQYIGHQSLLISFGSILRCCTLDKRKDKYNKDYLWQIDVPKVKRSDVRTNDISRFILKRNLLVCGNRDGCISIYVLNNNNRKPHLIHHIKDCHENGRNEVSAVEVFDSDKSLVLTTSYRSPIINCWNYHAESVLHKHVIGSLPSESGFRCMALNDFDGTLAAGLNNNSKPLFIDVETGATLTCVEDEINDRDAVRDIQWHNGNVVSYVTHSGYLRSIDARTNNVVYEAMDPFQCALYCLKTDGVRSIVVGSSEYARCVLFDDRKPTYHIQMYFTQTKSSPVYSLDFDGSRLFAAADRSVSSLNFNVNRSTTTARDYSETFEFVSG